MKKFEAMQKCLTDCVMCQMENLEHVDTKELGEAIDMIKDLAEAMYYTTITEAMKSESKTTKREPYYWRDQGEYYGHWTGGSMNDITSVRHNYLDESGVGSHTNHQEPMMEMRDPREGRSYISRRTYLESKEKGKDKLGNIQDLEHYMHELSEDITEMIEQASIEEKQLMQKKLMMLAQKIVAG